LIGNLIWKIFQTKKKKLERHRYNVSELNYGYIDVVSIGAMVVTKSMLLYKIFGGQCHSFWIFISYTGTIWRLMRSRFTYNSSIGVLLVVCRLDVGLKLECIGVVLMRLY
jgi:hypothetical protein